MICSCCRYLHGNKLTGSIPPELGNMTKLHYLYEHYSPSHCEPIFYQIWCVFLFVITCTSINIAYFPLHMIVIFGLISVCIWWLLVLRIDKFPCTLCICAFAGNWMIICSLAISHQNLGNSRTCLTCISAFPWVVCFILGSFVFPTNPVTETVCLQKCCQQQPRWANTW